MAIDRNSTRFRPGCRTKTPSALANPETPAVDSLQFKLFSKLPIEVRTMIWREAFPDGQHVCIGPEEDFGITLDDARFRYPTNAPIVLPVTLHISQESRKETLRNYAVLFSQECPEYADHGGASDLFVFAPKRDSMYVYFDLLDLKRSSKMMSNRFNIWMRHLEKKIPDGLKGIKTLEIRNAESMVLRGNRLLIPKSYRSWFAHEELQRPKILDGIRWLTGLKNLCLTMERRQGFRTVAPWQSSMLEDELVRWCEGYAKKCESYNVPQVVVRDWDKMVRSSEELISDIGMWESYKTWLRPLAQKIAKGDVPAEEELI